MMKVGIIKYGVGNILNLDNYFKSLGYVTDIIDEANIPEIDNIDCIVLPGVGSFNYAMNYINVNKLDTFIKKFNKAQKKIIGICLGFQLFFQSSQENSDTNGLGFLQGSAKSLTDLTKKENLISPHIGWNIASMKTYNFKNNYYYFLHKFCMPSQNSQDYDEFMETEYEDIKFYSLIKKKNILGVQFHPEKSNNQEFNEYLKDYIQ